MLQFRPQQYAEFEAAARRSFEKRAVAHLRGHYPERWEKAPEAEVVSFVRESEKRAAGYGLTTEQAVISVAHVRCLAGDDWESAPWDWIPGALSDDSQPPSTRAKLAVRRVIAQRDNSNHR